jgi:hypothetical protein
VPRKKTKAQQNDAVGESSALAPDRKIKKIAARRTSTAAKTGKPAGKKDAATGKAKSRTGAQTAQTIAPTDEEIRLRAFFISERRHRLALPAMPALTGSRPNDSSFPSSDGDSRWMMWHRHPADELAGIIG